MNQILINRRLSLLEQLKSKLIKDAAQSVEVLFASSALAIRLDVDIIDKASIEGDDNDQYHESLSPTCIWIRKLNQLKTLDENRSIETNTGNLNDSYNLDEEIALCKKVQQTLYTAPSIT